MKTLTRTFWFRVAAVLFLVLIAVLMLIIGRGHTLYFDNKTVTVNGVEYKALYKAVVSVKNNEEQKLYSKERGMASIMGQKVKLELELTETKNGASKKETFIIRVPYNLDGIVISIPALIAGADQEAWMSEFVSLATTSDKTEEAVVTDEFGLSDI